MSDARADALTEAAAAIRDYRTADGAPREGFQAASELVLRLIRGPVPAGSLEPRTWRWYCGGGMTDVGSHHEAHWSPRLDKPPRWCCGDPDL